MDDATPDKCAYDAARYKRAGRGKIFGLPSSTPWATPRWCGRCPA